MPPFDDQPRPLVGRAVEREMLAQVLADVRAERSRVLVLRGEAGVGKTSLLDLLASNSSGCLVVRASGVESEMELPFAGLHQLCAPMLGRLDRLPAPHRDALSTAFGLLAGAPVDRFMVGLAVLGLLSDAAEQQPVVCVVDDAQWLDQVSAQLLAFVARRLLAESVALVFAVREPSRPSPLEGLAHHLVTGLGDADARTLLDSVIPWRLDQTVRERIIAETRGNPLALLELPRGLTAAQLAGGFAVPTTLPIAGRIEQSFLRRVNALPSDAERLLLVAAADPVGDRALLRRAARRLGLGAGAEEAVEEAGLIEFNGKARFRHPLVRSAAYRRATAADRRQAHLALAESTDPSVDPDRRAWHRAHATEPPDDDVADDLERSADRAQGRGGFAAAAAFLDRAAQLTSEPARRSARALAAAEAKFDAGAHDDVEALLVEAERGTLDHLQTVLAARLRAQVVFARHRGNESPPALLAVARDLERVDPALARETYLEALGAAVFAGRLGRPTGAHEIAVAARAAPVAAEPRPIDALLDAVAVRFADGYEASVPLAREAVRRFRDSDGEPGENTMRWLWLVCLVACEIWDDEAWEELATSAVTQARASGALTVLPVALNYRASVHIHAGEFASAAALVAESDAIASSTGAAPPGLAVRLLVAWRGDEALATERLAEGIADAKVRGEGRAVTQSASLVAMLDNGLGRYDEALVSAHEACSFEDLGVHAFALVELIEAAARCEDRDAAMAALRTLEVRTVGAGTDWAAGMLARSRALLARGRDAEDLYLEAIERLGRCRIVVHLARAHLLYGEWLRREDRRLDARRQLRLAHEMLDDIGVGAYAERARRELRATGATARPRPDAATDVLTPQEAQIAELAGQGRTNAEIGRELFISARTVEYHVKKIFVKLGITSRRELRDPGGLRRAPASGHPTPPGRSL